MIYVKDGSPIIENNLFDGNNASEYGGAMYFDGTGVSLVENNIIRNNTATNGGGGIYCVLQGPDIIGNLIHNNTGLTGGGIQLWVSNNPLIVGNTIVGNTSIDAGEINVDHFLYDGRIILLGEATELQQFVVSVSATDGALEEPDVLRRAK